MKNNPKLPASIDQSTIVGVYPFDADGKIPDCCDVITNKNLSIHIPIFIKIEINNMIKRLIRIR